MLAELFDGDSATMTLTDRLEACECFLVRDDEVGATWETMAEVVRAAIIAHRFSLALKVLTLLESEIERDIFHDYLKGEYREEIERRIATLRLSRGT